MIKKSKIRSLLVKAAKLIKSEPELEEKIKEKKISKDVFKIGDYSVPKATKVEIKTEKVELPVKTVPVVINPEKVQVTSTGVKEEKKGKESASGKEQGVELKFVAKNVPETTTPLLIEFPKITEGIRAVEKTEVKGRVRGAPKIISHLVPKKTAAQKISSEWEPPSL